MTLREKVIELFEYRNIPQLLELVEPSKSQYSRFLEQLIAIQIAIYNLDTILESEWNVINRDLQASWEAIYLSLENVGIYKEDIHSYCNHIYKYQKHELSQRRGKSLLRFKMEYFYFYKSCDVKLIRRLVYEKYPSLAKIVRQPDWRWFDLITEVNDDIDDVFEDIATNNGNRFLLSIQHEGLEGAVSLYKEFINEVKVVFLHKSKKWGSDNLVTGLTLEAIQNTLDLLSTRRGQLKENIMNVGVTRQQFSKHI